MSADHVLRLKSKVRVLNVTSHKNRASADIAASVYSNGRSNMQIAFACADPSACRLSKDVHGGHTSLWIGSASFDVSDVEAALIARDFVPLGLRDQREWPVLKAGGAP